MTENKNIENLSKEISSELHELESTFYEVFVHPSNFDIEPDEHGSIYLDYDKEDKKTWLIHGTRILYYKICLFLELKKVPIYLEMFKNKFNDIISEPIKIMESRNSLYTDDEPSMIIHDDYREFLKAFKEFKSDYFKKIEVNKLKLILENTHSIINRTKTEVTNEASIYNPVKWVVELIFPTTRSLNKARFIKKFKTYHPDILVPEISSAVEYKFIREGETIEKFLDEIKIDADNYEGDPEFKIFYAVVFFEKRSELNQASFNQAILEKKFPDNWTILAL